MKLEKCEASDFILFFRVSLAIQDHLQFYMNWTISFPISVKKKIGWIFDTNYFKSVAFIFVIYNNFLNVKYLIDVFFFSGSILKMPFN